MSPPRVSRPARRALLGLLVLSAATIGVALAAQRAAVAVDPQRSAVAWSAAEAWATIILGLCAGLLVALALRRRSARGGAMLGTLVALLIGGAGIWLALPAIGLEMPACASARPGNATWQLAARTLVDGQLRQSLTLELEAAEATSVASLIDAQAAVAVEELGIELIHGAVRARHCRALVSGSQVTAALPLLWDRGAAGSEPLVARDLSIWRGELDWWVSQAGELVGVRAAVGGHPADAWPVDGLRGALIVELWRAP